MGCIMCNPPLLNIKRGEKQPMLYSVQPKHSHSAGMILLLNVRCKYYVSIKAPNGNFISLVFIRWSGVLFMSGPSRHLTGGALTSTNTNPADQLHPSCPSVYMYIAICLCVGIYICIYFDAHMCMRICIYKCIYAYICNLSKYIMCIYAYICVYIYMRRCIDVIIICR